MTIEVRGAYGRGNFGDDALMVAASRILELAFPQAGIRFVSPVADYLNKLLPGVSTVRAGDPCVRDADIVVYGGGTQFYGFPLTVRKRGMLRRIGHHLRHPAALVGKLLGQVSAIPPQRKGVTAAIGIGVGPFEDKVGTEDKARRLFAKMDYVAVRDISSYELARRWGCSNTHLGADLCYFPGLWDFFGGEAQAKPNGIRRVGVIVRDWPHTVTGGSYSEPLFRVVEQARTAGMEVCFISFAPSYDREWMLRLHDRNEQALVWDPVQHSISSFMAQIACFDAFITARYHGAVFSSLMGRPAICIEVEQKLRLVAEMLGDGASCWSFPFVPATCLSQITKLNNSYVHAVESMHNATRSQQALARRLPEELQRTFCGAFTSGTRDAGMQ